MEIKTKVFLNRVKRAVANALPWVPVVFTGMTVGAAWAGYKQSQRNAKAIGIIKENEKVFVDAFNHNARIQKKMQDDVRDLLDRAMDITEGKEETPAA